MSDRPPGEASPTPDNAYDAARLKILQIDRVLRRFPDASAYTGVKQKKLMDAVGRFLAGEISLLDFESEVQAIDLGLP